MGIQFIHDGEDTKLWAGALGIAIIGLIVAADTGHLGFLGVVYDFPYGDKVGHFLVFGLMTLLANLAAFEWRPDSRPLELTLKTSGVLALLIGLEELSQRWLPSRTSSLLDLVASYLGVAVFAWLAFRIDLRCRRREQTST